MTVRLTVGMLAVGAMLAGAGGALAQTTVLNPTTVEFDPSPDHSAVTAEGLPVVSRYELRMYLLGSSLPTVTTDLGKPAAASDGKIRVNFSSLTSPWPPPDGSYEARVAAVGPSGVGQSDSSNPFSFSFASGCTYTLSAASVTLAASGGRATVTLTTGSGCQWSVGGVPTWLAASTTSGVGGATLTFTAGGNPSTDPRAAALTIAGRGYNVTQSGTTCSYSLSSSSGSVAASGGSVSFTITASSGCGWTVTGAPTWVSLSASTGVGGATLTVTADRNDTTAVRTASLTVGGRTYTLTQAAGLCAYVLSPSSVSVGANGGAGTLTITTQTGCRWSAASNASWITLATAAGTGSGQISYTAAKNTAATTRTGTVQAGGKASTFTQSVAVRPSKPKKPRVVISTN